MRLNLLIGVSHRYSPPNSISPRRSSGPSGTVVKPPWGPPTPDYEPEEGRPHINTRQRPGDKLSGDPRPKLSATRAISHELVPSYMVNSSADQYVPRTPEETANPDVSGFKTRVYKSPKNTGVGDESFGAALQELKGKR